MRQKPLCAPSRVPQIQKSAHPQLRSHAHTHTPAPTYAQVSSTQLRDDLLSMLVAGHETTGSALTWTLYLLVKNPEKMAKAQVGAR